MLAILGRLGSVFEVLGQANCQLDQLSSREVVRVDMEIFQDVYPYVFVGNLD